MPKQSLTKRTMVRIYNKAVVRMATAMLLISRSAGVLANHTGVAAGTMSRAWLAANYAHAASGFRVSVPREVPFKCPKVLSRQFHSRWCCSRARAPGESTVSINYSSHDVLL